MTATLPAVVSAEDFTVASAPRNQRASPSPGPSAMGATCVAESVMGGTLAPPPVRAHPRRGGSFVAATGATSVDWLDGGALEHGPADRGDRGARVPWALAPRVLRRARAPDPPQHPQRRDVLAHPGSAHAA